MTNVMYLSLIHIYRGGKGQGAAGFRGQDFNAELHLSIRDAAQTHKQILTVNGKQVRITIPVSYTHLKFVNLRHHVFGMNLIHFSFIFRVGS